MERTRTGGPCQGRTRGRLRVWLIVSESCGVRLDALNSGSVCQVLHMIVRIVFSPKRRGGNTVPGAVAFSIARFSRW